MTARAHIPTERAVAHLSRFCRHFAHWHEASHEERTGSIRFERGSCELVAGADQLTLVVSAGEAKQLERLKRVVAENLTQIGAPERLAVDWEPETGRVGTTPEATI